MAVGAQVTTIEIVWDRRFEMVTPAILKIVGAALAAISFISAGVIKGQPEVTSALLTLGGFALGWIGISKPGERPGETK